MCADAASVMNDHIYSQLGYIISLTDNSGTAHVLDYCSKDSKRVVRSTVGGESLLNIHGMLLLMSLIALLYCKGTLSLWWDIWSLCIALQIRSSCLIKLKRLSRRLRSVL